MLRIARKTMKPRWWLHPSRRRSEAPQDEEMERRARQDGWTAVKPEISLIRSRGVLKRRQAPHTKDIRCLITCSSASYVKTISTNGCRCGTAITPSTDDPV